MFFFFIFNLDITIELRALGVPWTLHCWMHALAAAHELRLDTVIDQLLQDFLQVCPDDYSQQFVMECLPLLFNIFRYSKVCVWNFIYVSCFLNSFLVCVYMCIYVFGSQITKTIEHRGIRDFVIFHNFLYHYSFFFFISFL